MTGSEYQALAMKTASPTNKDIIQAVLGLTDEVGELAKLVKNHRAQGHALDVKNISEEAGDLCWYLALLADTCGLNLDTIMENNIIKLKARYGDKFTAERSIDRIKLDMLLGIDYEVLKELTTTDGINTGMLVHDPLAKQRYLDSGVAALCGDGHICRSELFLQTQNEVLEYVWRLT